MTNSQFNNWVHDQLRDLTEDEVFNTHKSTNNFVLGGDLEESKLELTGLFFSWRNRFKEQVNEFESGSRTLFFTTCNN